MGIIHGFSCINICRVPKKSFKEEAAEPSIQASSETPEKCKYIDTTKMIVILALSMILRKLPLKTLEKS